MSLGGVGQLKQHRGAWVWGSDVLHLLATVPLAHHPHATDATADIPGLEETALPFSQA